jgi:hypothetical protein
VAAIKAPPGKALKTGPWLKSHKQEAALGAGGIVVAIALYVRSKNASSSSSGASSTTPATADTTSSDLYNALEGQIANLQQGASSGAGQGQTWKGRKVAGGATVVAPATPAAPAAPNVEGYGTTALGGSEYDILGNIGSGQAYSGYEVGGGAPVYFETPAGGNPETNLNASQVAGLPAGTEVLTPVSYGGQIGSTAGLSSTKGWG